MASGDRNTTVARACSALLILLAIWHTAWICDDAFISARVVDNFLSGLGLRWNPSERVQVYTHPAWLLGMIVARLLCSDPYWSLLGLALVTSAVAVFVGVSAVRKEPFAVGIVALLALCKPFVEYSSSGLENPLSHLLIALLWRETVWKVTPSLTRASLLVGLLGTTRLDLLIVAVPALLLLAARQRRYWPLCLGAAPLLAWQLFALAYYGSLLPNTALAKLGSELTRGQLLVHGLSALWQPMRHDPLSVGLSLVGIGWGLWRGRTAVRALCAGAAGYVLYLVWIGGDFMAGRFLSVPLLLAVLSLAALLPTPRRAGQLALLVSALLLSALATNPIWARPVEPPVGLLPSSATFETCVDGVCDERAFYAPYTGIRRQAHVSMHPPHPWSYLGAQLAETPGRARVAGAVGFRGYFAGPRVPVIDYFGLCDPLLSRLPPAPSLLPWKAGHLPRNLPLGYVSAVSSGPSALFDPALREYYARIWLVTRGPLWSWPRWRAIAELHGSAPRFHGKYRYDPRDTRDELP